MDEQQARQVVLGRLQQTARARQTITYSELATEIGWAPRGMGALLGKIVGAEAVAGRPLLTAVVVRSGKKGLPGDGFFTIAQSLGHCLGAPSPEYCWRLELQKTYEYWAASVK